VVEDEENSPIRDNSDYNKIIKEDIRPKIKNRIVKDIKEDNSDNSKIEDIGPYIKDEIIKEIKDEIIKEIKEEMKLEKKAEIRRLMNLTKNMRVLEIGVPRNIESEFFESTNKVNSST